MIDVSDKTNEENGFLSQKWTEMKEFFIEPDDDELTPLKIDIIGSESLTLSSDVTDYYSETNNFYNDQISIKPRVYTLEGEIGELVWYKKDADNSVIGAWVGKLTPIVSFLPSVAKKTLPKVNKALKIGGWIDSADNIVNRLVSQFNQTDINFQQKEYRYLAALWLNRSPMTIISPWQKLENFVITNIEFSQPRTTRDKTLIKMTFKEFRLTKFKTSKVGESFLYGRLQEQKEEVVDRGRTTGEAIPYGQGKLTKEVQQCLIEG